NGRRRADDNAFLAPIVRATDIEEAFDFRRDRPRRRPHGLGEAGELLGRLPLVALDEQEAPRLRRGRLLREDERHRLARLVAGEVAARTRPLADLAQEEAHALGRLGSRRLRIGSVLSPAFGRAGTGWV